MPRLLAKDQATANYSAAWAGHSAFAQQESAFAQQESAFTQQESAFAQHESTTHSVAAWQHSDLHFLSITKYTTAPTTQSDTTAINTFFITLKKFIVCNVLISLSLENRCKITLNIAYMQKKVYFCGNFNVFSIKLI